MDYKKRALAVGVIVLLNIILFTLVFTLAPYIGADAGRQRDAAAAHVGGNQREGPEKDAPALFSTTFF